MTLYNCIVEQSIFYFDAQTEEAIDDFFSDVVKVEFNLGFIPASRYINFYSNTNHKEQDKLCTDNSTTLSTCRNELQILSMRSYSGEN